MNKLIAFLTLTLLLPFSAFADSGRCTYAVVTGDVSGSDRALTLFNSRRMLAMNKLIKWQLDRENSETDREALAKASSTISHPETKAWDDPAEVSKRLRIALADYLLIMEKKDANGELNVEAKKNLDYARDEYSSKLHDPESWNPGVCNWGRADEKGTNSASR